MTRKSLWLFMLLMGVFALNAAAANFKCDVYVGSSEGISLTFGQAAADDIKPFPPFSAMFGVKDVFLANAENFSNSAAVEGDMARLSTDLRTGADKWVIVANSNASLKMVMEGADKVYCAFTDAKSGKDKTAEIANGGTLSVKAGVTYTIALAAIAKPLDVAEDTTNATMKIRKNGDKVFLDSKKICGLTAGSKYTLCFATTGKVGPLTRAELAAWTIEVADASNGKWNDDGSYGFTAAGDSITFTAAAESGSVAPLNATVIDADSKKIAAINAILMKFGTLDFDGDGKININDVMYLYNFMVAAGEIESADELSAGTKVTDLVKLNTALENLSGDTDSLDYDEDKKLNINDVMYFYNFMVAAGEIESADELSAGTKVTDLAKLNTALENLNGQKE